MSNNSFKVLGSSWKRGTAIVFGLIMVSGLAALLFYSPGVHAQLANWRVLPRPEAYSELYFNNHLSLPSTPIPRVLAFQFSIRNVEGHAVTYPYQILLKSADGKVSRLSSGQVLIPDGASRSLSPYIVLPQIRSRSEVMVVLPDQQQEIHFWLGGTQ